MNRSPNPLPEPSRAAVCRALNATLADTLELYGDFKLAHWNVRGPNFPAYHKIFGEVADALLAQSDTMAERVSTLGEKVLATTRFVSENTTLPPYEATKEKEGEHIWGLSIRMNAYVKSLHAARTEVDKHKDVDTSNMLTDFIQETEKFGWFFVATAGQ